MADKIHRLKTIDYCWDAVASGEKTFEIRRNDRGYQRGDIVRLQKIDSAGYYVTNGGRFETHDLDRRIGFMLTGAQFGIEPGFVLFSLEPVNTPQVSSSQ